VADESASSLQKGSPGNLLAAEVSVDFLNCGNGPFLPGQVSFTCFNLFVCSCLAGSILLVGSGIAIIMSFLKDWNLLREKRLSRSAAAQATFISLRAVASSALAFVSLASD